MSLELEVVLCSMKLPQKRSKTEATLYVLGIKFSKTEELFAGFSTRKTLERMHLRTLCPNSAAVRNASDYFC